MIVFSCPHVRRPRPGFSLVELLIAAALGLVVMSAVATLFGLYGRTVSQSQSIVEVNARLRNTAWQLRQDLQGITAPVKPWLRPEANAGYFELIEGPRNDASAAVGVPGLVADTDDILMFTTASQGRPFSGRLATTTPANGSMTFESPVAEVAWFCKPAADGSLNLHRRILLVSGAPGAGVFAATNAVSFTSWDEFYRRNDLSCRREGSLLFANSLGDLTRRESRFSHNPNGQVSAAAFPYAASVSNVATAANGDILTGVRGGEDVILSNVLAFDVRVFDPERMAVTSSYVDLGPGGGGSAAFVAQPAPKSKLTIPTYDTWSMHYEFNGIDEDAAQGVDQGTNGLDDNSNGIVDDEAEFETLPPYRFPLRGIEVRIRCQDPGSKQVRQMTVVHSFE